MNVNPIWSERDVHVVALTEWLAHAEAMVSHANTLEYEMSLSGWLKQSKAMGEVKTALVLYAGALNRHRDRILRGDEEPEPDEGESPTEPESGVAS